MAAYLLIESRDPFDSNDVAAYYRLASDLVAAGNRVTLFLVQNGVLPARAGARAEGIAAAAGAGVDVLADEFSLRERGIRPERLVASVRPAPLEVVVDQLASGAKVLWH
jgi:sulfur relay (sulfurtransferase) complex TusBCD TusD component (DsrE family)